MSLLLFQFYSLDRVHWVIEMSKWRYEENEDDEDEDDDDGDDDDNCDDGNGGNDGTYANDAVVMMMKLDDFHDDLMIPLVPGE